LVDLQKEKSPSYSI